VAAFWAAAIDEDAIEERGVAPLAPALAVCDAAASDRTAAVATLQVKGRRKRSGRAGRGRDAPILSLRSVQHDWQ
jgi:predicted metalloendopeptidase